MPFPLLLDEMLRSTALWTAILERGSDLDVVRVGDANLPSVPPLGASDADVLCWAIEHDRIVVTQDVSTMIRHHGEIVSSGIETPGLVVLRRGVSNDEAVESLVLVSNCTQRFELISQTIWLP